MTFPFLKLSFHVFFVTKNTVFSILEMFPNSLYNIKNKKARLFGKVSNFVEAFF